MSIRSYKTWLAVDKAYQTRADADIKNAKSLVAKADNARQKNLNDRLSKLENSINQLDAATSAVDTAYQTLSTSDINTAKTLIAKLNPSDQTLLSSKISSLENALNRLAAAFNAVQAAEAEVI